MANAPATKPTSDEARRLLASIHRGGAWVGVFAVGGGLVR
jgi:hypothetical protein